jgi:hypothetical protein
VTAWDIARSAFWGFVIGLLVAVAVASVVGTVLMVNDTTVDLSLGPIPFLTSYPLPEGVAYRPEWGMWLVPLLGGPVRVFMDLRSRGAAPEDDRWVMPEDDEPGSRG